MKHTNGETSWRRPSYAALHRMVENPVYGGAYAYGRTTVATGYGAKGASVRIRRKARADWLEMRRDDLPTLRLRLALLRLGLLGTRLSPARRGSLGLELFF